MTCCNVAKPRDRELDRGDYRSASRQEVSFRQNDRNPVLDFVRQLDWNGARFSTIRSGDRPVEGVLLTLSPLQGVLAQLGGFCRDRCIWCRVESRSPRLSIAILGDQAFQETWELQLITSQYGDFTGLKFSI
jgi:hypothetical protein